jgi:hypothetical protein
MQGEVGLSLTTGQKITEGTVTGQGSVTFHFGDATTAKFGLNYRSPNEVILSLGSTTGVKIANKDLEIRLGGEFVPGTREISGDVALNLRISKEVAASISQTLSKQGDRTELAVTVTF